MQQLEISKDGYRAVVDFYGTLKLFDGPRILRQTTYHEDGTVTQKDVPLVQIAPRAAASPLVAATWAGDGYWNVDLDCGMQRWNGTKHGQWLGRGLAKAGFTAAERRRLMRKARTFGPQSSAPRYY